MSFPPDPLEDLVHQTLRRLPQRTAPTALEARVLAELARRQQLPWWHRSWAEWPGSARFVFLFVSAIVGGGVLISSSTILRRNFFLDALHSAPLAEVATVGRAFAALAHVGHSVAHLLSLQISQEVVLGFFLVYALVLALGAGAYRALAHSD